MKKTFVIVLSLFLVLPMLVKASGSITIDKDTLEITEGNTVTFSITADNSVGRIIITPADDTVVSLSESDMWIEKNTLNIVVTGLKEGSTTLEVVIDAATFDEEVVRRTDTVNVTVSKYSINYELNGGSHSTTCAVGANPESAAYNTDVVICNPTKVGYTFTGWTSTTVEENAVSGTAATPNTAWDGSITTDTYFRNLRESGSVTMVANFTPNTDTPYVVYHYTKDLGASTYTLHSTDELTGTSDATLTLANLSKPIVGFTYDKGSFTGDTNGYEITATTIDINPDGTTKVYLFYNRNVYLLELAVGDGITNVVGAGNYEFGANVEIDATVGIGYTWDTWTVAVGTDPSTFTAETKNQTIVMGAGDTMLEAHAIPNTYNIVYDLNSGSYGTTCGVGANPETGTYGSNVLICNPTRAGYTFTGWTSTTIGENAKIGVVSTLVTVVWDGNSTKFTYFKNLVENGTVLLVANWVLAVPEIDESTGYRVSDGLLVGETPKVETGSLDLGLDDIYTVRVNDKNGNEKTEGHLGTGDRVQIYFGDDLVAEYAVCIKGDVDGNGEIAPLDYIKIKKHIMETNLIVGDEYISAADMSNDGEISPLDYVKVRNYIMAHSD